MGNDDVWLGLTDLDNDGIWEWFDLTTVTFTRLNIKLIFYLLGYCRFHGINYAFNILFTSDLKKQKVIKLSKNKIMKVKGIDKHRNRKL